MSAEQVIDGRPRDLGGFSVRRVLPSPARRMVGPFTFFDHMGAATFAPGEGMDVRPHPHIGLATVTYLYEGEILHRDSLGSEQPIRPGAINWMTAGRGIVHSERSPPLARRSGGRVHGLQLWVALPLALEETAPSFHHHDAATLPELSIAGARVRVLAGSAYGAKSPVEISSPLFFVDALIPEGGELVLPEEYAERAVYVVEGAVNASGQTAEPGRMLVFNSGPASVRAEQAARVALVGGAPLEGERHLFWNFVSSSRERLERAKTDWRERRFAIVPGDDKEWIPIPENLR